MEPPSIEEIKQCNDPEWLLSQANLLEEQTEKIVVILRKRAEYIKVNNRMNALTNETDKLTKALAKPKGYYANEYTKEAGK